MENNQIDLTWCGHDWQCCMEGGRIIHEKEPWVWYNLGNIGKIKSGDLLLGCVKNPQKITYWDGREFYPQYSGGLIRSLDTFSYGIFSAEIIMPEGKGLWPAFWLCGEGPWPASGEIDIMEGYTDNKCFRLTTPYFPWLNPSWTTTTNIHCRMYGEHRETGPRSVSVFTQPHQPSEGWHKYEAKWTPDKIVFSVDGKVVRTDTEAVKWFSGRDSRMRVIFDCLCLDPAKHEISMEQPMEIRNFNYEKL